MRTGWINQDRPDDKPPNPVRTVTLMIFDEDIEWDTVVMFEYEPDNIIRESIELAFMSIEEAKRQ